MAFAELRQRFKAVLALRCTCRTLRDNAALPTLADFGRLVWAAFEGGRIMPGLINKLITRSADAMVAAGQDNAHIMTDLARYVLSPVPATKNCALQDRDALWAEVMRRVPPAEQVHFFGTRIHRNRPKPLLNDLVARAKELAAAQGQRALNVPIMALVPRRDATKKLDLRDAYALDELVLDPGTFQPRTPGTNGRVVMSTDLHTVRHVSKCYSKLAAVAKWPRERVKRWVRNRNRIMQLQSQAKRRVKRRLRRHSLALRDLAA
jgi:hypothetical protein